MKSTSERLKEAMAIREMKQSDLIEKTGINKGALSSYISGRYNPKQGNLFLLAKALNVNEAWLMGADVPMERGCDSSKSSERSFSSDQEKLLFFFNQLNAAGRAAALERIEEMTQNKKFIAPPSSEKMA